MKTESAAAIFAFLFMLIPLSAPAQVTFRCPAAALNIHGYEQALRAQILTMFDPNTYVAPAVRVRLVPVSGDRKVKRAPLGEFLSGATFQINGLSVSAGGSLSFAQACRYTYRARITVTANDYTSGTRLRASTDSLIQINSPGEYEFGKITASAAPAPGGIPTAAPTSTAAGS